MRPLSITFALLLASCASDGRGRDAGAPDARSQLRSIDEGDWFVCADPACSALQTTGLRLADHEAFHLVAAEQADGLFTDGDPYCVGERFGTYDYASGIVTLALHDGGLVVQAQLAIDDAGLTAHGGDMHKVHENATGRWVDDVCVSDD